MSTLEAEKQILVMSINTRKIHKMHAGHLNQHAPSKEVHTGFVQQNIWFCVSGGHEMDC